ncbi:SET and MYND domain-containing protein 4-like [Oppia nitens]|uniref:SET and MYND domain-containing protein 4-like n=1 Tax=Oppia nitens TaxID=1686743 RepID=UPI0023D9CF96|nr:SET and MYND domain-containing protein 4-like [Oppia nitens]
MSESVQQKSVHMNWSYVCNHLTQQLQSNEDFWSEYKTLTTNADKVKHCLTQPSITKLVGDYISVVGSAKHRKYWEKAKEFRIEGNDWFRKKCYEEAIETYNQAILFAPLPDSSLPKEANEELSLSFANRSAVFYYLKQYDNCLHDINKAIKFDYPLNTTKLYLRKANCLALKSCYGMAKSVIDSQEFKANKIQDKHIESQINTLLKTIESKGARDPSNCVNTTKPKGDLKFVSNELMPNASEMLTMTTSETKGRYIIANQDINLSDMLFIETPYASVLLPQYYINHCHHCYGKLVDKPMVPCLKCSQVRYCSDKCVIDGWHECHEYECGYLDIMHDIGIAHLALRILLVCGVDKAIQLSSTSVSQTLSTPNSDAYLSVWSLVDHTNDFKPEDSLNYSLVAILLLFVIKKFELISSKSENYESLGGIILKHILQLITNGHSIASMEFIGQSSNLCFQDRRIATAIYPTVSLMNHSCDPNVIAIYDKKQLIVRAAKPIAKGQEVMNCYGPHCKRMSLKDRQTALLEQYFFTCDCSSCSTGLEDKSRALQCNRCKDAIILDKESKDNRIICLNCKKDDFDVKAMLQNVQKGLTLLADGSKLIDNQNYANAETTLLKSLEILDQVLYSKNRSLGKVKDELCRCYNQLEQWSKSVQYCRESVHIVTEVFGDSSIEMSNELIKLSELEFEFMNNVEGIDESIKAADICLVTTAKAIKLLNNYTVPGDHNSPQMQEIKRLEERLMYCNMFSKQFQKKEL